jgi:hypothetical protein
MKQLIDKILRCGICVRSLLVLLWFACIRWVWMNHMPLSASQWTDTPYVACILVYMVSYTLYATFKNIENKWWAMDMTKILLFFNSGITLLQIYHTMYNISLVNIIYLLLDIGFLLYFRWMYIKLELINLKSILNKIKKYEPNYFNALMKGDDNV